MAFAPKNWYLFLLYSMSTTLYAYDPAQFYRASFLNPEPRLECAWLSTIEILGSGGETHYSNNSNGTKVPLLDIYGPYNMRLLGSNIANLDLNKPTDKALAMLAQLPARDGFGKLSFLGVFEILEAQLMLTQNFCRGFFFQCSVPLRSLGISNIHYADLSPVDNQFPNAQTPEWQNFLNLFDSILQEYGLGRTTTEHTGVGDIALTAGWTINYGHTQNLDFIDFTAQSGILLPTGAQKNEHAIFDVANGYNGHIGIPLIFDISCGAYEWLTIGGHLDLLVFFNRTKEFQMKTAREQSGLIKLAHGRATLKKGPLVSADTFIKADHFFRGLTFIIGYCYNHKKHDTLTPADTTLFDVTVVNSDEQLASWRRHTLNLLLEYDFTQEDSYFGPRMALFYNHHLSGKRVFDTSMAGGSFGLEIAHNF